MQEQLRDIKGIVEVQEYSLWWLLGLIAVLLATGMLLYYFLRLRGRKKRRFRKRPREIAREHIEAIDYSDPKSVAYTFIEDVAHFVDEDNRAAYEAIVQKLTPYKYKKEVPPLDAGLRREIEAFIRRIKWQD
jgi:hypothetical protein